MWPLESLSKRCQPVKLKSLSLASNILLDKAQQCEWMHFCTPHLHFAAYNQCEINCCTRALVNNLYLSHWSTCLNFYIYESCWTPLNMHMQLHLCTRNKNSSIYSNLLSILILVKQKHLHYLGFVSMSHPALQILLGWLLWEWKACFVYYFVDLCLSYSDLLVSVIVSEYGGVVLFGLGWVLKYV